MPVEIEELSATRTNNNRRARRLYRIIGATDETEAKTEFMASGDVPSTIDGKPRDLNEWEVEESEEDGFIGTAVWSAPEWATPEPPTPQPAGEFYVSFDISGQ